MPTAPSIPIPTPRRRARSNISEMGFTAVTAIPPGRIPLSIRASRASRGSRLSEAFCKQIRAAVGDRCDLLFGTRGQFTVSGAKRLARRLEPYAPLWFEEPTPPEMPGGNGARRGEHFDPDRDRRAVDDQI